MAEGSTDISVPTAQIPVVVINEIQFKPQEEGTAGEFMELYNPGDSPVDISGWELEDAITYTIPNGTEIPAGGYLVIGEDPATLQNEYGVAAIGPYSGNLSSKGEQIDLRDSGGTLIDRVEYGVGFPWPSGTDGGGPSIERINSTLESALAGSWRAAGALLEGQAPLPPFITAQAHGWRYQKGLSPASVPADVWRQPGFDDSSWDSGQAAVGYNIPGVNTTLGDMANSYSSVYLRKEFTFVTGEVTGPLRLRLAVDDGCIIWLNGHEIARRHVGQGELAHDALASSVHNVEWEEIILEEGQNLLQEGSNIIAVHVFNASLGSSDLSFDMELMENRGELGRPTPGARNSVYANASQVPPHIEGVSHTPNVPKSGQEVVINASITDPDGVGPVSLLYQLVDPGSYIRLTDPEYVTDWISVPMTQAGGNVWTATLPGVLQTHRRLVRYRIRFEDLAGNAQTVPYPDEQSPNFAYFINDGMPEWSGALRPGQTPLQTYPVSMLESIPVYTLIANDSDVISSQYDAAFDGVRCTGTFVYDDRVYDHIEFRNRGEASTYVSGKNKWRFYFNRAQRLEAKDTLGRPYKETWKNLSANACSSPWAPVNRGGAGADEALPFRAFQLAGMAAPHTHYYHFRIVRGEEETPEAGIQITDSIGNADGQYAGDFWGLYLAVEPIRGNFLDERGLPEGNIYEIENNEGDKKEQAVGQPIDSSDWVAFRDAHLNESPNESWWREHMDMEAYYSFHAINRLMGNVDLRGGNNHYFYHRSSDGRWVPVPWDLDMMFIAIAHHRTVFEDQHIPGVIHAHKSILQHPALALEFRNRGREILDLLASDSSPEGGQIGQLLKELTAPIHTPGELHTWANADAAMWNLHPRTPGIEGDASGYYNHRGNFFRSPFTDTRFGGNWTGWLRAPDFTGTGAPEDLFNRFRDYVGNTWPGGFWNPNIGNQLGYGHQALLSEVSDDAIPATPLLSYIGDSSYPADGLAFEASEFSDPHGSETFAARQWRIAEISRNEAYEMEALWSAVTESAEATSVVYPASSVIPGRTYRARVRQRDDTGRWSHWSAPVTFVASPEQSQLVHYWNFNQGGSPEDLLSPSVGSGSVLIVNGQSTEYLSGSGQDFAAANAQNGDPAGSHLRVNNPIGATATFHIPTTHFMDLVVRFETRRSGQGAGEQLWSYTLDGEAWGILRQVLPPDGEPAVTELDFRSIPEAGNNPHFAVRVEFSQGLGGEGGNNRIDNFTLTGKPMEGVNLPPVASVDIPERLDVIEGQSLTQEAIASWFIDPDEDPLSLTASSSLPGVVSVSLEGDALDFAGGQSGEALVTLTAEDGTNAPVEIEVRVLVHPAPHLLASSDFNFTDWSPDAPERSYPASMLFLQGDGDDSSLTTLLDRAYFIPHDDYSSDDDEIVGWPYKATARTRMNGLGNDGVSFINTGRGRDLGGALLALDTRGSKAVHLSFTSGTVKPNSRHYSMRLQYRIGIQGDFVDLTDGTGQPVEYNRHVTAGHASEFPDIELPSELLGRPYVQLLWRYYQSQDGSGPRAELRLDDVQVSAETATYTYHEWRLLQFNDPETIADDTISGPQAAHGPFDIPNLQRYALGISLHDPLPPHIASITPDGEFRFRYNSEKSDVIWLVKTSANLADWTTTVFDSRTDPKPDPGEDGWLRIPIPESGESRLFMRLELQLDDPQ